MKFLRYLVLSALFICIFTLIASAASTVSTPSKAQVKPGEEFTVTVKLDGEHPVLSMGATPVYSTDAFEIVSGEWLCKGALLEDFNVKTGDGVIMFTDVKTQNGDIFKFTLKAKDTAPAGSYNIKTNLIINYNSDDGAIHCIAKICAVEVITDEAQETAAGTSPETTAPEPLPETTAPETTAPETLPETTGDAASTTAPETTGIEETKGGYVPQTIVGYPMDTPTDGNNTPTDNADTMPDKQTYLWIAVAVAGCIILGIIFGRASKKS